MTGRDAETHMRVFRFQVRKSVPNRARFSFKVDQLYNYTKSKTRHMAIANVFELNETSFKRAVCAGILGGGIVFDHVDLWC